MNKPSKKIYVLISLALLLSCNITEREPIICGCGPVYITGFGFLSADNNGITSNINAAIVKETITVSVPSTANVKSLKASFKLSGYARVYVRVKGKDVLQVSGNTTNDFTGDVIYTVIEDGFKKNYTVRVTTVLKQEFKVTNGNVTLPVWIRGNTTSRALLVMCSGGPGGWGHSYMYMNKLTATMEPKYTMVYWDQRGASHTKTGGDTASELTIANCAGDLKAVVEQLKTRYPGYKIFLAGESWGGMLVPAYLVTGNNQKNIAGWIQIAGAHNIPLSRKLEKDMILKYADQEIKAGRNVSDWQSKKNYATKLDLTDLSSDKVKKFYDLAGDCEKLITNTITIPEGEKESESSHKDLHVVSDSSDFSPNVFDAMLPEVVRTSQGEAIKKLTVPVLVIYGKYDFLIPPGLADEVINNVQSTIKRKVEFSKSGHNLMEREPAKAHGEMIKFIDEVLNK